MAIKEISDRRRVAMISSSALDLPEHLNEIRLGCERAGFEPRMMLDLPASDAEATQASLRLIEEADVYVGIFAYKYGHMPNGSDISIGEIEYNHAVELNKPRLIFFIHQDHPIKGKDLDSGPRTAKLQALKDRIENVRVPATFESPRDLGEKLFSALTVLRKEFDEQARRPIFEKSDPPQRGIRTRIFICYRHSDSRHFAGRLYDRLLPMFDDKSYLYMDVEANRSRVGKNYLKAVEREVQKCKALLVIIGGEWLNAREAAGRRRLHTHDDLVRIEILTALKRQIKIIPVLIDGTKIPDKRKLPDVLSELVYYPAFSVHHESFHHDVDRLIQELRS